jgi:hypothetical protein
MRQRLDQSLAAQTPICLKLMQRSVRSVAMGADPSIIILSLSIKAVEGNSALSCSLVSIEHDGGAIKSGT